MNTFHLFLATRWVLLNPSLPPDEYFLSRPCHRMITSHPIPVTLWILLIPSLSPDEYFSSHPCHLINSLIPSLSPFDYFSSHPCHRMNTSHPILATGWLSLSPYEYFSSNLATRWEKRLIKGSKNQDKLLRIIIIWPCQCIRRVKPVEEWTLEAVFLYQWSYFPLCVNKNSTVSSEAEFVNVKFRSGFWS